MFLFFYSLPIVPFPKKITVDDLNIVELLKLEMAY